MTWDGLERRAQSDHDILLEIKGDVKHLVSNFASHVVDDKDQWDKIESINVKIAKWSGIGTGAGVIIGFLVRSVFK